MMPSMRSVWIVVAICGLFFSCLAATGCGDDMTPTRSDVCGSLADELCSLTEECGYQLRDCRNGAESTCLKQPELTAETWTECQTWLDSMHESFEAGIRPDDQCPVAADIGNPCYR